MLIPRIKKSNKKSENKKIQKNFFENLNTIIKIPLPFCSPKDYFGLIPYVAEHKIEGSKKRTSMSYLDILVFAAAQYLDVFTTNDVLKLIGCSKDKVRESIKNLKSANFIRESGINKREKIYRFTFKQNKIFIDRKDRKIATIQFPAWILILSNKRKLSGLDICMFGEMYYFQYIYKNNLYHEDTPYQLSRAMKNLNIQKHTAINSLKKLEKEHLIKLIGKKQCEYSDSVYNPMMNIYQVKTNYYDLF